MTTTQSWPLADGAELLPISSLTGAAPGADGQPGRRLAPPDRGEQLGGVAGRGQKPMR